MRIPFHSNYQKTLFVGILYSLFSVFMIFYLISCSQNKVNDSNLTAEEQDLYNQKNLYVKYKFDTIIIISDFDTSHKRIICLDSLGNKKSESTYCGESISEISLFDELENEITKISYGYDNGYYGECAHLDTTKIHNKRTMIYKNGLLVKSESIDEYGQLYYSIENLYDNKGRVIKHREFSYGSLSFLDSFSYEPSKIIETRIGGESHGGKQIGITEIKLDSLDREIESSYFDVINGYRQRRSSISYTEYDKFGHECRYASYSFPEKKMGYEVLTYYSDKSKLDSTKQLSDQQDDVFKLKNKTIFTYDKRKLLSKKISENYVNKSKRVTNYEYK